mmetsp:Transcript_3326/g.9571  ORF Transcript_3326/g.9571 Transcript_3326/m.9571 type:complete len:252 (+) Transcript_3326:249-1004(+)
MAPQVLLVHRIKGDLGGAGLAGLECPVRLVDLEGPRNRHGEGKGEWRHVGYLQGLGLLRCLDAPHVPVLKPHSLVVEAQQRGSHTGPEDAVKDDFADLPGGWHTYAREALLHLTGHGAQAVDNDVGRRLSGNQHPRRVDREDDLGFHKRRKLGSILLLQRLLVLSFVERFRLDGGICPDQGVGFAAIVPENKLALEGAVGELVAHLHDSHNLLAHNGAPGANGLQRDAVVCALRHHEVQSVLEGLGLVEVH